MTGALPVHDRQRRSPEPNAVPLLMSHGWPGSVLEFRNVIGPDELGLAGGGTLRQGVAHDLVFAPARLSAGS